MGLEAVCAEEVEEFRARLSQIPEEEEEEEAAATAAQG